ncbi:MAG: phage tail protein [Lachnospiraceae bacterium]|nr:phage tail protein [Lachnospiraceae bacterium]MCM1240436.1 phage tail protein [Lachnospiraceae bacterium]
MAKLGTLGNIVFSVSDKKIQTFDDMSLETSARYYTHDRHLMKPLLEFGGLESDKLSFTMHHSVFLGVDPEKQVKQIDEYVEQGEILSLIIGGKRYGSKWVIKKHSKAYKRFDRKGRVLEVESKVTLEEYASR